MTALERLNRAYDQHKDQFAAGLHSTLWEVLVNATFAGKVAAFCNNHREEGNQLGVAVANERGYCPTPAYFKPEVSQDEAWAILESLNSIVFDLPVEAGMNVLCSSMAAGRAK